MSQLLYLHQGVVKRRPDKKDARRRPRTPQVTPEIFIETHKNALKTPQTPQVFTETHKDDPSFHRDAQGRPKDAQGRPKDAPKTP